MVSLRAGQARVYDAAGLASGRGERLGDLAHDAPPHRGVAHDALRRLGAAGLELRLDEHERLPARAPRAAAPGGSASFTEMNDTSHVTSCGANGSSVERAGVDALEHRHARVVPELRRAAGRSRRRARSRAPRRAAAARR